MKPTLQLRLGQSLTMTPQLQQAIRLLQLSTLELQQEIQQALDNNPLLEQEENEAQETSQAETQDASQLDSSDAMAQESMPDELPVDTTWDEGGAEGNRSVQRWVSGKRDNHQPNLLSDGRLHTEMNRLHW